MAAVCFGGKYMTWLFIDPSETEVVNVSVLYFRTVFWCYPVLGKYFLYRNTLQGMGYGLVPMLGGVLNLQQECDCYGGCRKDNFSGSVSRRSGGMDRCADSTCAILFFYTMRKWKTTETKIQKQI